MYYYLFYFENEGRIIESTSKLEIEDTVELNTEDPLSSLNSIPIALKLLEITCSLDKSIRPNTLPSTLETLFLGNQFNQSISTNSLPSNLSTLILGDSFNQTIEPNTLPPTLKEIVFGNDFNQPIISNSLPLSLKSLRLGKGFTQTIQPNTLPSSLENLSFGDSYNIPIPPNILPSSIHTLNFGNDYNQIIQPNSLPVHLKTLRFGKSYNQILQPNTLPTTLEVLVFGESYNQTIQPNTLPLSLKTITFGDKYNQTIQENILPSSLELLEFGKTFNKTINSKALPSSIKKVKINNINYKYFIDCNELVIGGKSLKAMETITINSKKYHKLLKIPNTQNNVFIVSSDENNVIMICKEINYTSFSQNQINRMWNEKEALELLKGKPNFVQLIDYYNDDDKQILYLFTEYYQYGDLNNKYNQMIDKSEMFTEKTIWSYIFQFTAILETLEELKIVHCDIQPSNIFLKNDKLILGDFGSCCFKFEEEEEQDTLEALTISDCSVGSEAYTAPEVKSSKQYDYPMDVYSFGATILLLLSSHQEDIIHHYYFLKDRNRIEISPERYSDSLIKFAKGLLSSNPSERSYK